MTRRALEFAARRHAGQQRESDHAPFILHPLEVAQLLRGRGYPDEVVAAGVLHDVIEDAHVEYAELSLRFGEHVAVLVRQVSEPSADGTWVERKARLREAVASADADAAAIYAADKVAKVREFRLRLVRHDPTARLDQARLDHYWASLELLERRLGHHPFVSQLRFELEALDLLPPEDVSTARSRWRHRLDADWVSGAMQTASPTEQQQAVIESLGLVDVQWYEVDAAGTTTPPVAGSVIGWQRDAQHSDVGTVIEPDGRVLIDASDGAEWWYPATQ